MKLKTMLLVCGVAAGLCLGAGSLLAQPDDGTGPGGPGGGGPGGFGGGRGGFGGGRGGFGAGGNFDPAQFQQQMQQMIMDQDRQSLGITNDDEWAVIQPLIQKVLDAQQALATVGGMGMRGGGRGGRGGAGAFGAQASEEQQSLQQALANNAPIAQVKDALAKYRAARKVKQANLETAQANLQKVLTTRQEAQAVLLGLLP
jgi:hypothetical protein